MIKKNDFVSRFRGARRMLLAAALLAVVLVPSQLIGSDIYTFSTIPGDGNISGAPGSISGWGYSITNLSTADWLLPTFLNADSFGYGTPTPLFDYPEVGPGITVTELFDPILLTGLYQDLLTPSAPIGSADSGNFVLSAQWYDGDPFNGGNLIGSALDTSQPYTATVAETAIVPEPSTFLLAVAAVIALACERLRSMTGFLR